MLKAAVAFLPLLAGYIFVSTWHQTRYLVKREDSQKLYIRAAFWGIWLFLLSLAIVTLLRPSIEPLMAFLRAWQEHSDLLHEKDSVLDIAFWSATLAVTLLLGMFGGYLLNWGLAFNVIPFRDFFRLLVRFFRGKESNPLARIYDYSNRVALKNAIRLLNSDLDLILMRALDLGMPICVTLGSGKVYVGYVTGGIDPGDTKDMLRILPYVSGYRADGELKINFTTWYISIYRDFAKNPSLSHLNPELFEIVFPLSEIKSVNLFDINAYQVFQKYNSAP